MTRRVPTTKDIGLLKQLHDQGQLTLAAEFQRNQISIFPVFDYKKEPIVDPGRFALNQLLGQDFIPSSTTGRFRSSFSSGSLRPKPDGNPLPCADRECVYRGVRRCRRTHCHYCA
jgi:hypothetical protein